MKLPIRRGAPLRRPALQAAAACALAAALTMAAPTLMFAVGDAARFGRPSAAQSPYQSRPVEGDDLYLVRLLKERDEAVLALNKSSETGEDKSAGGAFYLPAPTDLQYSELLAPRCAEVLQEMEDAGVLPADWLEPLTGLAQDVPASFVGSTDTLGFLTISGGGLQKAAMEAQGQETGAESDWAWPGGGVSLNLVVESRTGKAVSLQAGLSGVGYTAPDAASVLRAWVALNDLDILGDWQAPAGTRWEQTGLYSANGGLLATFVWAEDPWQDVSMLSLDLVPCTAAELSAARAAGSGEASGIADGMVQSGALQRPGAPGAGFNDGSGYYFAQPVPGQADGLMRIVRVDYAAGSRGCVCTLPGCSHDSLDCPACFDGQGASEASLYVEEGQVYVLLPFADAVAGGGEPARVLAVAADGRSRRTVAELQTDDLEYVAAGGGTVYGLVHTDGYDYGTQPANLVEIRLADGQRTLTPTLVASGETVLGCQGGCLVTARPVDGRAGNGQFRVALGDEGQVELCLLDPASGSRRRVAELTGASAGFGVRGEDTHWLVRTSGYASGGADYLNWVDLLSGEVETTVGGGLEGVPLAALAAAGDTFWDGWVYFPNAVTDGGGNSDLMMAAASEVWFPSLGDQGWYPAAATGDGRLLLGEEGAAPEGGRMALFDPFGGGMQLLP